MVSSVSRISAGLVAVVALATGVVVGALAFSGSEAADDISRGGRTTGVKSVEEANWVRGETAEILGTARDMRVSVAGLPIEMSPPQKDGPSWWEGSLQPAGLVQGPLSHQAGDGQFRWEGSPPLAAPVEIEIEAPSRESVIGDADISSVTYRNVVLHAGFG